MINKLLRFFCAILVFGSLFASNIWAASAFYDYISPPFTQQLSSDGNALYHADPPVVYVADPNPSTTSMRIPVQFDLSSIPESATANFSITYATNGDTDSWYNNCVTFPEAAKTTFNAAAAVWGNILQSSVPITIKACWSNSLPSTTLGSAGDRPLRRNFSGAPRTNTWYVGSLANALAGYDLDPADFDMHITYNGTVSWYYGTDGNPSSTQYDLMSVIMHEIAHGLNFTGSMAYSGGTGNWGYGSSPAYPGIYDIFMRDGSGQQLIDTGFYVNPSINLGSALTSENIWFHGSNAMAANGGQRVKMYAPSTWDAGSSYVHMDYNTFHGTENQLMVYAISKGDIIHDPGPITKGILKDVGWPATQTGSIKSLYFPHIATIDAWQTEIAIINTGSQTASGTLKAFSNGGQQIETKTVSLVAHGRRQISIANEFANHANIGHIIFDTTSDTVQGYIKFYQDGIYRVAIPAVKEVNTSDIYVPHIASSSEWWTGLSLVNTNATAKTMTINFNDGQTKQITVAANGHSAFAIRDLFNSQPQPGIQSAVITNASGIIGLELFGSFFGGRQLEGVLLTDKSTLTLYYPHVENSGWWTGIVAYNPSSTSCSITTTSYSTNGSYLSSSTQSISGRQKLVGTTDQLGIPSQTAWFQIDSTKPLNGFELMSTNSFQLLAAYGMNGGTGTKAGIFAKIEKNGWTTIALVNTESTTATVTMTAYTDNGTEVATQNFYIGGHAKLLNSAEGLFPQNIASATYIAYTSDKNMVGLQLNGSSDWTMLDGLPVLAGVYVPPVVCNYSISPTSKTFNSSGGTGSVNVTTTSGCSWMASTNEGWIAITAGSSGSGNGTVSYSVSANTGTSARSGAMTIAGQTFTVSQAGASVTSDALIGNYKFVFNISTSTFTDRITMNTKSSSKTSEGTDIYTGYSADYPSVVMAAGAWYPSLSKYIIVTARTYASSFMDAYYFSINADNTLPGCYKLSSDDGNTWSSNCYSFLIPASHKTPLGSWDMLTESDTDYININEVNSKKIAEDKQAHTQRIESSSTLDNDLVSKINELMAILKNNR